MMKQRITIGDVAKAAGVSKQTVSRAINDKGEIKPETKARIMQLIEEMDYRPSRMAQAMNTQRSHMVGLVIPDITNPFFPEIARGTQDSALANNYSALISNSDEQGDLEIQALEMLAMQGVDGIITFSHNASEEAIAKFADNSPPLLIINRQIDHPNVHVLLVDNYTGACMAAEHLIELGHTKIAMLSNETFSAEQVRRAQGFIHAVKNSGLPYGKNWIIPTAPTVKGGYDATRKLLHERPDTTAVFCYNDTMAFGAVRASRDAGFTVPDQFSVIGFDGIQMTEMYTPALSTIYVDKYELGQLAFQRLHDLINGRRFTSRVINMSTQLIVRESTGPSPR